MDNIEESMNRIHKEVLENDFPEENDMFQSIRRQFLKQGFDIECRVDGLYMIAAGKCYGPHKDLKELNIFYEGFLCGWVAGDKGK